MKEISLTRGQFAIVDDHWFDRLAQHSWFCSGNGYAYTKIRGAHIYMHRMIAKTPKGLETDHINRNRLDNRECNLRNVTHMVNLQNRGPYRKTKFHIAATGPRPKPPKIKRPVGRPVREGSIIKIRVSDEGMAFIAALQKRYPELDRGSVAGVALEAAAAVRLLVPNDPPTP